MKIKYILSTAIVLIISISLSAQLVSKDSINNLKQQKEALKIGEDLTKNKLKLAELQNSVEKKTQQQQNAAQQAQNAASDNSTAASNLSTNVQDEKLAKQASKKANDAKNSTNKANKADKDLEKLNNNIEKLQKQIAEDEAKLATMPPINVTE
ncbi:MAG: hypothetical protein H7334_11400 [Ferruginibacter sp.]|nr:hypothetical protein [Ferruginibacter sp.]